MGYSSAAVTTRSLLCASLAAGALRDLILRARFARRSRGWEQLTFAIG
jgi:hypothetical protein